MREHGRIKPGLIAIVAVVGLLLLVGIGNYNGLVSKQAKVDQSFADLDAQLQRRADLVPNLVAAVRGVLTQEQTIFGQIAQARQRYAGASTPAEKFGASNELGSALQRLLVIVENYPQLRSSDAVRDLMIQVEGTENRIAQARRDYNGVVTDYNVVIRRFPKSVVAGILGFDAKPLFTSTPESRVAPKVDLISTPVPQ